MSLVRALDLLEFWRREAEAQIKAMRNARNGVPEQVAANLDYRELSEQEAEDQMRFMPMRVGSLPGQEGMDPTISRIPEELRDMIRYAEDFKAKRRVN